MSETFNRNHDTLQEGLKENPVFLEEHRLERLYSYNILNTEDERAFDQIADDLSVILKIPTVLISFVDRERQWFKACIQFEARETSRRVAFCSYTILSDDPLVVEDATTHPLFQDNPLVTEAPHIRSYAGVPLITPEGYRIGTVCCIDYVPRTFTPWDTEVLERFARRVMTELEERLLKQEQQRMMQHLQDVILASRQGLVLLNAQGVVVGTNPAASRITGMPWHRGQFFEKQHLQVAETLDGSPVYARPDGEGYFTLQEETLAEEFRVLRLEAYGIQAVLAGAE